MTHITTEQIKKYYSDELSPEETLELLTHTASCEFCAGRLASGFPEDQLLTPPADLKTQIIDAARTHRKKTRAVNRTKEFWGYTAKVVFAMAMGIFLVFNLHSISAPKIKQNPGMYKISDNLNKSSSSFTTSLNKWSAGFSDRNHKSK